MTPGQRTVLDFVRQRIETTAVAPTLAEIAHHIGTRSKSVAHRIVEGMVHAGHIRRDAHAARGLSLPDQPSLVPVPTSALEAELARRGRLHQQDDRNVE